MNTDPLAPQARLRTRVIGFFLLAGLPAVVLSAVGVFALDRLVAQEISDRERETTREAERIVADERARVDEALTRLVREDAELKLLAGQVEAADLRAYETLAGQLAPTHGLDLLAIVAARGPHAGTLLSSAHLPAAVGDDAPPFVVPMLDAKQTPAAFTTELAEGNPPEPVPALIGGRVIRRGGTPALVVYGGARLDGHRLAHVARAGQATFVLRGPPAVDGAVFPPGARPARGGRPRRLELPALGSPGTPPARLEIHVEVTRLRRARRVLRASALALGGASLLAALVAGAFLSRRLTQPIVELSEAAREVGAGRLDVQLEPRSRDEVGTLVRVFNRMTTELSESRAKLARAERVAAWQQIARRVAHEIKNPLFPIQMSMETLKKSYAKQHPKLDEIVEESTRTVLEEVRALNRIVTEFSDFARLPTPQRAPEPAAALLSHVLGLYKDTAGVTVRVEPPPEGLTVFVDRAQISRALINLVKNAIEALPEGGQVTLRARPEPKDGADGAWLDVEDDGPGMPEDVQAQVFTPYFTTKAQGTGLGLAIVDRIVTEHGGEVRIASRSGLGTTVSLWLPAAG